MIAARHMAAISRLTSALAALSGVPLASCCRAYSRIAEAVSNKVSLICTDGFPAYSSLDPRRHRSVDHARGQYVVGAVHTQTIEGFWSLIKRGMVGTFHKVSAKYLPLYVAEFEFRYNNRSNDDIFGAAVRACGN
jgi:ISXO2-like transposase domain